MVVVYANVEDDGAWKRGVVGRKARWRQIFNILHL